LLIGDCRLLNVIDLRLLVLATLGIAQTTAGAQTGPSPILVEQRRRELVMVRHLRQHVVNPGDGLALAADRRDLQRLRSGVPPGGPPPPATLPTDDELVDSLGTLVDLWYVRLVDRQPFGTMPRERVAALQRVQQSVGRLQSRGRGAGLDQWLPEVMVEADALLRATSGQGELQDASIDLALRLADAAASGRPLLTAGPHPPPATGPGAPTPELGVPRDYPPPPGAPADQGPGPVGPPPPPPGSSTPYNLPPVYREYGQPTAEAGGYAACQTLRVSAGVAQSVTDMLRAAECWTRTPSWPGWGEQALEALDWALGLASAERTCGDLARVIESARAIGPRLAGSGMTDAVLALARRGEADRRRLLSQSLCR
jgi:hypothetical protein